MKIQLKFSNSNALFLISWEKLDEYLVGFFFGEFACNFVGKITFQYLGEFLFR